jgi:flagellar biosynthesis component FlhA
MYHVILTWNREATAIERKPWPLFLCFIFKLRMANYLPIFIFPFIKLFFFFFKKKTKQNKKNKKQKTKNKKQKEKEKENLQAILFNQPQSHNLV